MSFQREQVLKSDKRFSSHLRWVKKSKPPRFSSNFQNLNHFGSTLQCGPNSRDKVLANKFDMHQNKFDKQIWYAPKQSRLPYTEYLLNRGRDKYDVWRSFRADALQVLCTRLRCLQGLGDRSEPTNCGNEPAGQISKFLLSDFTMNSGRHFFHEWICIWYSDSPAIPLLSTFWDPQTSLHVNTRFLPGVKNSQNL